MQWSTARAANSVFTLPLVGRVGARRQACAACASLAALRRGGGGAMTHERCLTTLTPTPNLSPQGGGEHTECAANAWCHSSGVLPLPGGERVGVRGAGSIEREHNPSPHPSPYGRGSRPSLRRGFRIKDARVA
jgi:hypothetical protein